MPNLVKLNTNENLYPPSPRALGAVLQACAIGRERYSEPESLVLREAIGARHGFDAAEVFVGNGSGGVAGVRVLLFFSSARICWFRA